MIRRNCRITADIALFPAKAFYNYSIMITGVRVQEFKKKKYKMTKCVEYWSQSQWWNFSSFGEWLNLSILAIRVL